jgi:hypothetical protein
MVFAKIMGVGDFIAIILILFAPVLPMKVILYGAAWLILKGGIFAMTGNIVSMLDVLCGLWTVALAFGAHSSTITIIVIIFLGQKVVFSML